MTIMRGSLEYTNILEQAQTFPGKSTLIRTQRKKKETAEESNPSTVSIKFG